MNDEDAAIDRGFVWADLELAKLMARAISEGQDTSAVVYALWVQLTIFLHHDGWTELQLLADLSNALTDNT